MSDTTKEATGKFDVTEDGKLVENEDAEPTFSLEFDEDEE